MNYLCYDRHLCQKWDYGRVQYGQRKTNHQTVFNKQMIRKHYVASEYMLYFQRIDLLIIYFIVDDFLVDELDFTYVLQQV